MICVFADTFSVIQHLGNCPRDKRRGETGSVVTTSCQKSISPIGGRTERIDGSVSKQFGLASTVRGGAMVLLAPRAIQFRKYDSHDRRRMIGVNRPPVSPQVVL